MKPKKHRIVLGVGLGVIVVIILLILFLIYICSPQAESKADRQELVTSEVETEQEEITEKKEPVVDKHEEPVAEQKQKAPEEKIILFDVDAAKNWQDSGLTVTPEMHITIAFEKGKWTIDYNRHAYVDAEGYPGVNTRRDYPLIEFGALIGKIGDGKAFKVGKYYEISESDISGNLYLKMNDLSALMNDNRGSITVKIIVQ
ncbi:MAG: hypothetical protein JW822_03665 [Spirochaetales bacterium]|nr:hypothetical protein [Spirochaetales bacterium]